VLRNRVYLGEVYFRNTWHPGQHPPLIDPDTFNAVQELLDERGEAHSKRASNASEYLLSGRVRCLRCGKAYIGAAAHGKLRRYPYYVCFSRQRYGTNTCPGERLRADLLDQAVINALLEPSNKPTCSSRPSPPPAPRPRLSANRTRPNSPP
jgi:site-specific DNA recombinase